MSPSTIIPAATGKGKVRVLVLIKCLDRGGAERLVTSMVEHRDRDRFDYEVAYLMAGLDGLVDELHGHGVVVHCLGARSNYDLSWGPRLRRLLRHGRYDIVHSHLPLAAIGARLVTRTLPQGRPRIVYTEHNYRTDLSPVTRLLDWSTTHLDDHIFAVSEANRATLSRRARARSELLHHGIDRAACARDEWQRAAQRAALGVSDHEALLVTVANLRPQKAYPTLLRAVRVLVDDGVPVRLVAAGGGPLRRQMERLCSQLGLGDCVSFLGFHPDTVSLAAAADIFVLASDWEAMPVAIMEALAVGAPVVATAVGDVPWALEDGRVGLLVPPGDPGALASALRRLIDDPDLRDQLRAAALVASVRFDIRAAVSRVEQVYQSG